MHIHQLPSIAVYTGEGASHSWTWFADIFERTQIDTVAFVDETALAAGALDSADVLFVSGGDTFAIAAALGQQGARVLERFIRGGGMYIGACAGAYLLLKSSLDSMNSIWRCEKATTPSQSIASPVARRLSNYIQLS